MGVAYSKEFRREVLASCDAGMGTREVATLFDVSESWVRRIKLERRVFGKTEPSSTRQRVPKWSQHIEAIERIIEDRPDITLNELKQELGTDLSTKTLCIALQKMKLTVKKKFSSRRNSSAKMSL